MNEITEFLKNRRSVLIKLLDNAPIAEADIEEILVCGLRVPDHPIPQALLHALNEPLMSATLIMPGDDYPMTDPYDIRDSLEHEVDLVIDGGFCGLEATSVIDLTGPTPVVLRAGVGDVSDFEIA